jgi:hypothetical protein
MWHNIKLMNPVCTKFLLMLLALLQVFAPLVHAHTGEISFNQGIHIPGLETLHKKSNDILFVDKVNQDFGADGILVIVDAGIKSPQDFILTPERSNYALAAINTFNGQLLLRSEQNYSPHDNQNYSLNYYLSPAPRAPPSTIS